MKKFSGYFFLFWSLLFLLFAFVQLNDPDPEVWASIYVVAAIFSVLAVRGKHPLIPLGLVIVACLVGAVYYFPESVSSWISQEMEQKDLTMKTPQMEEARETFGLLLIALVLSYSAYLGWNKQKNRSYSIH
jgi:glucan phosphoethanolaminetransferase (alkaline phosphatase superfamily)